MALKLAVAPLALLVSSSCSQSGGNDRACTPPLPTWGEPHPHLGPDIPAFVVSLDRGGAAYLDGKALDLSQLSAELQKIGALENPEPAVILETEWVRHASSSTGCDRS
ncbi:MAG TPA: hypothetical protein VF582_02750 [Allosphingosinicella sp.]|jgi:hypothetical protein